MTHDISRNVVAILLVLVIVVSAIGTWAFLTQFEARAQVAPATGQGQVQFSVARAPPEPVVREASVQLTIVGAEGQ